MDVMDSHQGRGLRPPAKLYGHVHSTNEANAARAVATFAPGIANVESYLDVTP
jgi:osmotically-inducible protein OsmY